MRRNKQMFMSIFFVIFIFIGILIVLSGKKADDSILMKDKFLKVVYLEKTDTNTNYIISRTRYEVDFILNDVEYSDINHLYDNSACEVVSIYLVYEDYFEIVHIDVDIMTESPIEIQVDKNIDRVYYAFTEYDVVAAITYSENTNVKYLNLFKSENEKGSVIVGGNMIKRVFEQSNLSNLPEEVSFIIYNAFSYDEIYANTKKLGTYRFIIKCKTNT